VENQIRSVHLVGVNHETAPIGVRERLAFDPDNVVEALYSVRSALNLSEILILSTCNRTEIYFHGAHEREIVDWFAEYFCVSTSQLQPYLYTYANSAVVEHAARVASGINSMVLGETQILGQLKEAFRKSQSTGSLGVNLNKVFQIVFSIAKEVRTKTEVGSHSVSLASIALRVSSRIFEHLDRQRVLLIGAGEMIRLCAKHFESVTFKSMCFVNRSEKNAEMLALEFGASWFGLEKLGANIDQFDIVVSCTASPIPILGKGLVEAALKARKHKPMLFFDLAVPRDIEEEIADLEDVFLYSIDDLGEMMKTAVSNRERASRDANEIIARRSLEFSDWKNMRALAPFVSAFRAYGEELTKEEVEAALLRLKSGHDPDRVISQLANGLKNKFLDRPCRVLRDTNIEDKELLAKVLLRLFELDNPK
jgi:glutamyl-tRNA reductase